MTSNQRWSVSLILSALWAVWGIDVVKELLPGGAWWWTNLKITLWLAPFVLFMWWGNKS